jgi:transposase
MARARFGTHSCPTWQLTYVPARRDALRLGAVTERGVHTSLVLRLDPVLDVAPSTARSGQEPTPISLQRGEDLPGVRKSSGDRRGVRCGCGEGECFVVGHTVPEAERLGRGTSRQGAARRLLPDSFGADFRTAHRRFGQWTGAGLWRRIHVAVLDELGARGDIDWSRATSTDMHPELQRRLQNSQLQSTSRV